MTMSLQDRIALVLIVCTLCACNDCPVSPPPPPPPITIEEQIAAWNPRIVVEEPVGGSNPSWEIATTTPGDTICAGRVRFRIDSVNVPDSIVWALGAGTYSTLRTTITKIPQGTQTIQAFLRKRFRSEKEKRDTVVERYLERTFVSLDQSYSLTIGKWVPVDPTETRIDTLRVLYQEFIPGTRDSLRWNHVLGATKGCDTAHFQYPDMYMVLRRYAVNFERQACQQLFGELALTDANNGVYQFTPSPTLGIMSINVRRAK